MTDMADKSEEKKKRYYTIGDVSVIIGVKPHILRYWESEFPMLRPRKNRAGNRAYTERDIKIIMVIRKLLYEDKFTIEGAKKQLRAETDLINDQQIDIPFEKVKKKLEIKEIHDELIELLKLVKSL